jgi:hypothetical protein
MTRTKAIIAVLTATMAFGAVAASSATAEWYVGGAKLALGQSKAVAPTATVDETSTFNIPQFPIKITCSGPNLLIKEGSISNPESYIVGQEVWDGCAVTPSGNCSVSPSSISSTPVLGTVTTAASPADKVTFAPQTKKTIAIIPFSGELCALAGEQPLTGSFTQKLPAGQTESESQLLEDLGSVENSSLQFASDKVYIEKGKDLLKLTSSQSWSFH